jgi:hypothetical protein
LRAREQDLANRAEVDRQFLEEASRFGFQFRCASCAHVVETTRACSMGYPNRMLIGPREAFTEGGALVFCKYFELSETALPDP